jgi:outer membrane protein OmpA-like peptidoglycan-associated protein
MVIPVLNAQEEDAEGCTDHPMFTRMPNFYLNWCELREFDAYKFPLESRTDDDINFETVEGKYYQYLYYINEGATQPSALQVYRNFENALLKAKGIVVAKVYEPGNSYNFLCGKFKDGAKETWVRIDAGDGARTEFYITIVEKEIMQQVIQASEMLNALNTDGFIALDILFDTGKSAIKEESSPLIDQVYQLLETNNDLKVSIEGHTDNTGTPEGNKKLSTDRAKAVMDALIAKGIAKDRLSFIGFGQEAPVADNRTDAGRAMNRRVEIVKK